MFYRAALFLRASYIELNLDEKLHRQEESKGKYDRDRDELERG